MTASTSSRDGIITDCTSTVDVEGSPERVGDHPTCHAVAFRSSRLESPNSAPHQAVHRGVVECGGDRLGIVIHRISWRHAGSSGPAQLSQAGLAMRVGDVARVRDAFPAATVDLALSRRLKPGTVNRSKKATGDHRLIRGHGVPPGVLPAPTLPGIKDSPSLSKR